MTRTPKNCCRYGLCEVSDVYRLRMFGGVQIPTKPIVRLWGVELNNIECFISENKDNDQSSKRYFNLWQKSK